MQTCATCRNWSPKTSGEMAKHQFALCGLGPRWTFYPPQHNCQKWVEAPADVKAGRVKWLSSSR